MKISAVHITALTLKFILFSIKKSFKKKQFPGHFSSYLNIKKSISPLIDKINIYCGYSFSELEHKKSCGTYFSLLR